MEQNLNSSQNDFLWTLLAHPADDGGMYAYNLQRLVNDFPQSGILQALFAHISDEKNLKRASVYFNPRSLFKLINSPSAFADVPGDRIYSQTAVSSNGFYQHNRTLFNEQLTQRPEEITEKIDDEQQVVNDRLLTDTEPTFATHSFEPETTVEHEQLLDPRVEDTIQHDHKIHQFVSESGEEIAPAIEERIEDVLHDHEIHHYAPESSEEVIPVIEEHVADVIHDHDSHHDTPQSSEEVSHVAEQHVGDIIHNQEGYHHALESEEVVPITKEHAEDVIHDQENHRHVPDSSEEVIPVTEEHAGELIHDHEIHHHTSESREDNIPVIEEQVGDIVHDQEIHYHAPDSSEEVIPITEEHAGELIRDHEILHHYSEIIEADPASEEHGENLYDHEMVHPADELNAADMNDEHSELAAHDKEITHTEPDEEIPENPDEPIALIENAEEYSHSNNRPQPVIGEHKPAEPQALIEEDIDETFDEIVGIEDIDFSNPVTDKQPEEDNFFYTEQEEEYYAGEEEEESEQSALPISNAQDAAPDVNIHQDVSMYHDEKMPYTFMWWLDKTRKEHAANSQPYIKPPVNPQPDKKIKKGTDELQQQYYENIFHITSVEELDKNTPPPKAPYNVKRKEQVIIERFIKEEPQIKPQSSDKLDNENKAKKSSEDFDELVTETLAGIYSDQMLYHKAVASYKKLLLKYPEKSSYFAEKIEQLEKKIK